MIEYLIAFGCCVIIYLLYKKYFKPKPQVIFQQPTYVEPKKKIKSIIKKTKVSDIVYLSISINNHDEGKIIIKLFDKVTPKTCNNFRTLCDKKTYANSPFHRIIKDFMIQGGDYTNHDGTGGRSIYGNKFEDENFDLKHDRPYLLSMANSGPDSNGSQFFITTSKTPHLDGKHVVFGEVIEGIDLIDRLNNVNTDREDQPNDKIMISDCGIMI